MELFERVKYLIQGADKGPEGKDSLAQKIGINPHTLRGYLSKKREDNLWPLLDKILAAHPEISRNWLYFGEGQFLLADDPDSTELQATLDELGRARQRIIDLEGQVSALQGQVKALEGQAEALNRVVALQAQPLIGGSPFTKAGGAVTSQPVAHSSTEATKKEKDKTSPRPRK